MILTMRSSLAWLAVSAAALLAGCERPPVNTVQHGYRGTGMEQIYNPRQLDTQADLNKLPDAIAPASADGPRASAVFKNVKLLGDLSVGEFSRHMVSITSWVAPKEGCTYCHVATDFADDSKYTKVVARRMIQMTQHINSDWKTHVAETGVTCYTCHRGNGVPQNIWFNTAGADNSAKLMGYKAGQNEATMKVALASLPSDPFTPFLGDANSIRVIGTSALPEGNRQSTKQAEWTYGLMMHMSQSLGVNCTYCHNTRSFASWDASTPQRGTAWYGIRMARDLNSEYLGSLAGVFPPERLGPQGDVAKLNCATCHQGAYKPLYGQSMLKDHPELASGVKVAVAAPGVPASEDGIVYFAVGSAALPTDMDKALVNMVAALKANPASKATISGYHSAAGDLASNQELAKQRAFAVRDALKAAGIDPERVVLEKPIQTEANAAGEDPKARRVEIAVK
jgi:photosynthetic reaction center cytochrome c subunit